MTVRCSFNIAATKSRDASSLRGVDTNFHIGGFARFTGDRALDLPIVGEVNLRLLGGFVPGLDASGPAQVDASVTGTLSAPRRSPAACTWRTRLFVTAISPRD